MRIFATKLAAIVTISVLSVAAGNADASGGGGFKFGGSFKHGGFGISYGQNHHNHHKHHHHNHHHHKVYVKKVYTPVVVYNKCYYPYYSTCFVHPGDTWYTISRRCYGHSHLWKHIATYNRLGFRSPLVAGMRLRLPVVNGNGTLSASNAPASAPFAGQGLPLGSQGAALLPNSQSSRTIPATNVRVNKIDQEEKSLPTVMIGSTLLLDGQLLSEEQGIVRLRISGMSLPVEILEWTTNSAKVRLPEMDLAQAMTAEIEVLRADGSLASKSAVELTPAATRLALGN